jgi:hypothetical protein
VLPVSFFAAPIKPLEAADRFLAAVAEFLAIAIFVPAVGLLAVTIKPLPGIGSPPRKCTSRKDYTDLGDRRTWIPIIALTF